MTNQEIAIKSEVVRVLNKVFSGHLPPSVELSAESPYPSWDSLSMCRLFSNWKILLTLRFQI